MASYKPTFRDEESLRDAVLTISIDVKEAVDWVASNCSPEEVFDEKELQEWAKENGYTKEEE